MSPIFWKYAALRSRRAMREMSRWWRQTGDGHFLKCAVDYRDDARDCAEQAARLEGKERAA